MIRYLMNRNELIPQWLKLLEEEYQKLLTKANREVNVLDFGAWAMELMTQKPLEKQLDAVVLTVTIPKANL